MDVSDIIDPLNDAQREAVTLPQSHALVLAGAGSGKTRVLTHRIAWLNRVEQISPFSLMAVTFTNKAAREMRGRVEQILGGYLQGLWIGTFHSIAHRMLRTHYQEAGLPQAFQILDSDDQLRMIKRIMRGMHLDEKLFDPKQCQWWINARKDEGQRSNHIDPGSDPTTAQWLRIYTQYEAQCQRNGIVDFAELLLRSLELVRDVPSVGDLYRKRFRHILVDEFQDTNALQYAWLRLLVGSKGCLFAVGDDDQSIYGWRGARVENIQSLSRDLPDVVTVRLEQNYRSSGNILKAANTLIANNAGRLGKELWTDSGEGEKIAYFSAYNEGDEARFVGERVEQWVDQGGRRSEVGVLYRSNAQSRIIETVFTSMDLPYQVYGGLRFFDRAEIKDALAYLRVAYQPNDDVSFERSINQPPRGIGDKSVQKIRDLAAERGLSLWESMLAALAEGLFTARAANAMRGYGELINSLASVIQDKSLPDAMAILIEQSGLKAHYQQDKTEKGLGRVENLDELVNAASAAEAAMAEDAELSVLDSFLASAALDAGDAETSETDRVQMMTLHSAKGLEFPLVFLVGMEEGLFPSQRSLDDPTRLEEERRLAYVGVTRAEQKLYICQAETRTLYGRTTYCVPSRFISEIPTECIEEVRPRVKTVQPMAATGRFAPPPSDAPYKLGQSVAHPKFGEGTVLAIEGSGNHARVQVHFAEGAKWLVAAYAKLTVI